jgi:phosphoserine phosphatase
MSGSKGADAPRATRGFHNRLAVVFDFDRTLSSGTVDALLERIGVADSAAWREQQLQPMIDDGWDEILAKAWLLTRTAEEHDVRITEQLIKEVGSSLECYPGVEETLRQLRQIGTEESGGAQVEIYVLSSGFVDMITASPVADLVDQIWGSSLHWNDEGELKGVKRTVIHSEKSRYLRALVKGLEIAGANEPQDVQRHMTPSELHVPLDQMIYVGDGASDVDAFELLQQHGGIPLAVDHSGRGREWGAADHMFDEARVENLAPPDFTDGSEMRQSLVFAVKSIANKVALRRLGQSE